MNVLFKTFLNTFEINNELIEILYELLPNKFSHWSLKLVQSKLFQGQANNASTWLDKLQVYVGLPDWVFAESKRYQSNYNYVKLRLASYEASWKPQKAI